MAVLDPYKVLGVPRNASDDEIKTAYRRLAKQYHPDLNPGDKEAARKMKEINEAYELIKNPAAAGGSRGYAGGYGGSYGSGNAGSYGSAGNGYGGYGRRDPFGDFGEFWSFGGAAREDTDPELQAAATYLNARHYQEASTVLKNIPDSRRTSRWYYYSSLANAGLGLKIMALEHIKRAIQLDPDNLEYRRVLEQLEYGGRVYESTGRSFGLPGLGSAGLCLTCCALQYLCRFCTCGF